jgi:hypothetical protein
MLRRVIWLLLLVAVAYAVYRMIDPQGAQDLVQQMQSYFSKDTEIVQDLPDEVPAIEDEVTQEQDPQPSIDSYAVYTGSIDRDSLVELDYILDTQGTGSTDEEPTAESPEEPQTTTPTPVASTPTTTSSSTPTPTPAASSPKPKSLSNQDKADMKAFLNAIVE